MDSVIAYNLIRSWNETLYWPDTVLEMQVTTGIDDATVETCHGASLRLEQNNPNPFDGVTDVTLYVADAGMVTLTVMDMNGRIVAATQTVETHGSVSQQRPCVSNRKIPKIGNHQSIQFRRPDGICRLCDN